MRTSGIYPKTLCIIAGQGLSKWDVIGSIPTPYAALEDDAYVRLARSTVFAYRYQQMFRIATLRLKADPDDITLQILV